MQFIDMLLLGFKKVDACKKLFKSYHTFLKTCDEDRQFEQDVRDASDKGILETVQDHTYDRATGVSITTVETWMPKLDENKKPIYDKKTGQPVLVRINKTVTKHAPSVAAQEILLKAVAPQKYDRNGKVIKAEGPMEIPSAEEMQKLLIARYAKFIAKKAAKKAVRDSDDKTPN